MEYGRETSAKMVRNEIEGKIDDISGGGIQLYRKVGEIIEDDIQVVGES